MTGLVTAVHLYVTDLDQSIDFYSRLLGYGPAAAYDEGENAHSAFFVLEQQTFLVLTWDPDRGREVGGAVRLELAADEIERRGGAARDPRDRRQGDEDALRHRGLRPRRPGRPPGADRAGLDAARHRRRCLAVFS